jgi:hypothetical protein
VLKLADGLARSHRLRGFVTEEVRGPGGSRIGETGCEADEKRV